mmetsp:Transcript_11924/g.20866  ORF Transcript_11924/g.20866 Transcript_11924/m.20866 type:complete len:86 (+) Transcript_11924:2-259(+)
MEAAGLKPDIIVYGTMMKGEARKGNIEGCQKWMERIVDDRLKPNPYIWSSLVVACVNARDTVRMEQYFQEMLLAGTKPNVVSILC